MSGRAPAWLLLRLAGALLLVVGLFYAADWALRAENFPVQQVRFEGPFKHVTQQELEAVVLEHVRGNFLLVDLEAIKQRVEALPWVHRASVRRQFPDKITIRFSEQQLVARWGEEAWVNASGEVARVPGAAVAEDLPRLAGPDGSSAKVLAAFRDFRAALAAGGLTLLGLELAPRRSWTLELEADGGHRLTLVLDDADPRARLERFARAYRSTLAAQAEAIRRVDLRYTNGFAVEWQRGGNARVARTTRPGNEG
ncbi:MAG TPA: FtsQ-type POTRA domain-containing protein [Burkholderiales bacterium]